MLLLVQKWQPIIAGVSGRLGTGMTTVLVIGQQRFIGDGAEGAERQRRRAVLGMFRTPLAAETHWMAGFAERDLRHVCIGVKGMSVVQVKQAGCPGGRKGPPAPVLPEREASCPGSVRASPPTHLQRRRRVQVPRGLGAHLPAQASSGASSVHGPETDSRSCVAFETMRVSTSSVTQCQV